MVPFLLILWFAYPTNLIPVQKSQHDYLINYRVQFTFHNCQTLIDLLQITLASEQKKHQATHT
jgi:hypothetical protein